MKILNSKNLKREKESAFSYYAALSYEEFHSGGWKRGEARKGIKKSDEVGGAPEGEEQASAVSPNSTGNKIKSAGDTYGINYGFEDQCFFYNLLSFVYTIE